MCETFGMGSVESVTQTVSLAPIVIAIDFHRSDSVETLNWVQQRDAVAAALSDLGVPAQILSGQEVDTAGIVYARTLLVDEKRVIRWAPSENAVIGPHPTMPFDALLTHLASLFHADISAGPSLYKIQWENEEPRLNDFELMPRGGVLVSKIPESSWSTLSHLMDEPLWGGKVAGWSVLTDVSGEAFLPDQAMAFSRGLGLKLERHGFWREVSFFFNGTLLGVHLWGPKWVDIDPTKGQEPAARAIRLVQDFFDAPYFDAHVLAQRAKLNLATVRSLEGILSIPHPDDPFTLLTRLLGLPTLSAELAEGWHDPSDIPGVRRIEPTDAPLVLRSFTELLGRQDDLVQSYWQWWAKRPVSFWVVCGIELVVLVGLLVRLQLRNQGRTLGRWQRFKRVVLVAGIVEAIVNLSLPKKVRTGKFFNRIAK